ncbi:MAG TPA: alpha/beta fold hydrolase, partial [Polyangiaceae bacterium]|nr:alpha/beta fold hydrolase [Polyangiaceae bacterium]
MLVAWLAGCADDSAALVPPTADQDPRLPQIALSVAGHRRALHLETFGAADQPVLLVFHGGEGSDYRALLPLQALSERYFVVMWDARGSGLSERIASSEVSEASYADEVHLIKERFSPAAPATLIAYSSGGFHAAIALSHYPDDFAQLALIEPDPFDSGTRALTEIPVPPTSQWVNDYLWQNEVLTPDDHALADFKLMSVSVPALAQLSCDPSHPSHYPMWRLGAKVRADFARVFADADYRPAIATHRSPVLIVGTGCGPQGAAFQRRHVAPVFAQARVVEMADGVDHL